MADHSLIEWTDATWNPITGCSVVSAGCTNCYAMRLAGTRLQHHPSRTGLTVDTKAGPVWSGEVRLNEQWLDQPLRWKRPRKIFVCAHGDLFAENVPDEWIDRVFAVMALAPQHIFQVLTKRAARMRAWFADDAGRRSGIRKVYDSGLFPHGGLPEWPLPNVWLGVSAEDQKRADERIPALLETPAAIRFVSAEPLLGPINIRDAMWADNDRPASNLSAELHWIIVGGESGGGARVMHEDWVRSIRDQCATTGTPFFFKQWGLFLPAGQKMADGRMWQPLGGNRLRGIKALTGRLLDGIEHNGMPEARR